MWGEIQLMDVCPLLYTRFFLNRRVMINNYNFLFSQERNILILYHLVFMISLGFIYIMSLKTNQFWTLIRPVLISYFDIVYKISTGCLKWYTKVKFLLWRCAILKYLKNINNIKRHQNHESNAITEMHFNQLSSSAP